MNTFLKLFVIFTILAVIILSVVTAYRFSATPDTSTTPQPTSETPRIVEQQVITPVSERDTIVSGDVTIKVEDFMNDGLTFEDPMNLGNYILSDDIEYCLEDKSCPDNSVSKTFKVWFDGNGSVFFVRLLDQPTGSVRLAAEEFLQKTLNLSPTELCGLNYYMSVSGNIDSRFVGQHLLFSSCPGAQQL